MNKKSLLSAIILTTMLSSGLVISPSVDAKSKSGCLAQKYADRTKNLFDGYCNDNRIINTETPDQNAVEGEPGYSNWFFEIPEDQKCDLGLEFPDLIPDFDFGFERLNVCNVLQKVSANAVDKINEEFDRVEDQVGSIEDGINDYGDIDLNDLADDAEKDLSEYFKRRPGVVRPPSG